MGLGTEDLDFEEMLQNIFWLASTSFSEACDVELLNNHPEAYPDLWTSALDRGSPIRENKKLNSKSSFSTSTHPLQSILNLLSGMLVDIMLKSLTNDNNPLMKRDEENEFATHCLHILGAEDFTKAQREQIMQGWPKPETTVLQEKVLALKVKAMQHPAIYEGMRFKDLVKLADTLAKADELYDTRVWHDCIFKPQQLEHLALLKELTRLIFV